MSWRVSCKGSRLFRRAGLEWFYRLITQPWRAARMISLPVFIVKVLADRGRRAIE